MTLVPLHDPLRLATYTPISSADVIVFREGNYAVAVDGKTKEVIARSTDHAEAIRKLIGCGGRIALLGEFDCDEVSLRNDVEVFGKAIIRLKNTTRLFSLSVSNATIENISIKGIKVVGNGTDDEVSSNLIELVADPNGVVRNIDIDIDVENYYGRILRIYGSLRVENVRYSAFAKNVGAAVPSIACHSTGEGVYGVVIERIIHIVDDSLWDYFGAQPGITSYISYAVNPVVKYIYSEKKADGPTVTFNQCRGVKVDTVVGYHTRDTLVESLSSTGDIDSIVSIEPHYWGAMITKGTTKLTVGRVFVKGPLFKEPTGISGYGVLVWTDAGDQEIYINKLLAEDIGPGIEVKLVSGNALVHIEDVKLSNLKNPGIYLYGGEATDLYSIELRIGRLKAIDVAKSPATVIEFDGKMKAEVLIDEAYAERKNLDTMYLTEIKNTTTDTEVRMAIERLVAINLTGIDTGDLSVVKRWVLGRNRVYDSLPTTDEVGEEVLYYDGTYYYKAVWNGSAWVKTQLS